LFGQLENAFVHVIASQDVSPVLAVVACRCKSSGISQNRSGVARVTPSPKHRVLGVARVQFEVVVTARIADYVEEVAAECADFIDVFGLVFLLQKTVNALDGEVVVLAETPRCDWGRVRVILYSGGHLLLWYGELVMSTFFCGEMLSSYSVLKIDRSGLTMAVCYSVGIGLCSSRNLSCDCVTFEVC
jgi:hypothetical protein